MRIVGPRLAGVALLAAITMQAPLAGAVHYEDHSPGMRAVLDGLAVASNVVPILSAVFAPSCLPGYVVCKLTFAGGSLLFAGAQLAISGGSDMTQTRAILYRGFGGDWYLTGAKNEPRPLPTPPPPAAAGGGGAWEPPPR
jgi:hypothetical protein